MKNNVETFICRLSYEWNNPEGFFYKLNRKIIDYNGFNRTYNLLYFPRFLAKEKILKN